MRISRTTLTGILASTALVISVAGCSSNSSSSGTQSASASSAASASSSASAQPSDYTGLLLQVSDIDAPIPFTAAPPTTNPNGQPGAEVTFSSQPHPEDQNGVTIHEVRIRDTIQVLPDPAAAADALNSAKTGQASIVKDPKTDSVNVGSGGITLSGTSPDGSKGVTVLLFAEGRALVTLEFDGPVDPPPPADFIIGLGQKQADAIKKGLGAR